MLELQEAFDIQTVQPNLRLVSLCIPCVKAKHVSYLFVMELEVVVLCARMVREKGY
jgi:hypothetical protein